MSVLHDGELEREMLRIGEKTVGRKYWDGGVRGKSQRKVQRVPGQKLHTKVTFPVDYLFLPLIGLW